MKDFIADTIVGFVRFWEKCLTGHSEYKLVLNDFDVMGKAVVTEGLVAKKLAERMKRRLSERFGITVTLPVVVELVDRSKTRSYVFEWSEANLGKYHSQLMIDENYHMVYVAKGLGRQRFNAIIAHELTHAFLSEQKLFAGKQYLREGLARWAEYRILQEEGLAPEAEKLLKIRSWKHGRALANMLELEKKAGKKGLVPFLLEKRDIV